MEERLSQTSQIVQDKVLLRNNLELSQNCKGLVNTKQRRLPSIYTFYLLFFCFLVKRKHCLVDRISNFPDEVLARILSLLPLKEAIDTSILSRRWRYVWKSTMTLDFNADKRLRGFVNLKRKSLDRTSRRYVDWVNRVIENHTSHIHNNIEKFRVCFDLDDRFTSDIDNWIQFALKKRIQVLVLDFVLLYGKEETLYRFPNKLLGLGKEGALEQYIGFKSLKVLYLENVDVTGEVLEHLISHCPVLERLSVSCAVSLVTLRVVGPSIGLKYLAINYCRHLRSVEICDTNLVSFINNGLAIDLLLSNVPFLVEVFLSGFIYDPTGRLTHFISRALTQLSCCLAQLESLMLDLTGVEYIERNVFPVLANIKHFELTVDMDYEWSLSHLSSFMRAFPSLERLVLKLDYSIPWEVKINKPAKCLHHNLKVIEIIGYCGKINAVEHVVYLLENALSLEKIVVDPVRHWKDHHTGSHKENKVARKERKAREHATRHLKNKVPPTVEFVCL